MPSTKNSPAAPKPKKPSAKKTPPTREEIALRAYQIYLSRNGAPGNPFEDWTQAERELLANAPKPRRKTTPKSQAA